MGTTGRLIACLAALGVTVTSVVVGSSPAHAANISVTTTADSGPGSLREALAQAEDSAADDQITFAPTVSGTIELTSGGGGIFFNGDEVDGAVLAVRDIPKARDGHEQHRERQHGLGRGDWNGCPHSRRPG